MATLCKRIHYNLALNNRLRMSLGGKKFKVVLQWQCVASLFVRRRVIGRQTQGERIGGL